MQAFSILRKLILENSVQALKEEIFSNFLSLFQIPNLQLSVFSVIEPISELFAEKLLYSGGLVGIWDAAFSWLFSS